VAIDILLAKSDLRDARAVETTLALLEDGQARLKIERFALTANNVTYAALGEQFGYWRFFPAADGLGRAPVWGFADVVESRCPGLAEGARVFGFFPMSSHIDVAPRRVTAHGFIDGAPHRRELPPVYNSYDLQSGLDARGEGLAALVRPLFTTAFLIDDALAAADFHGAEQVLFASASSKTALGAAWLLRKRRRDGGAGPEVVGLTSAANVAFAQRTGDYDRVIAYDALPAEPVRSSVLIDMAGAGAIVQAVHSHFGPALRYSMIVGATHWNAPRAAAPPPGIAPALFFAPDHIVKRTREWGAAAFQERVSTAQAAFIAAASDWLVLDEAHGAEATIAAWRTLAEGAIAPELGLIRGL